MIGGIPRLSSLRALLAAIALAAAALAFAVPGWAGPGGGSRVAVEASAPISADGRFVAFSPTPPNLVAGDTNGFADVFVRDLKTGKTKRVSVDSSGAQAGGDSRNPSISADGRFVAFESDATNLVARRHEQPRRRLRPRPPERHDEAGERGSTGGAQGDRRQPVPSISADGRRRFFSDATNLVAGDTNGIADDVFVRDLKKGKTSGSASALGRARPNGDSSSPSISADGRFVAFDSDATNLVGGDATAPRTSSSATGRRARRRGSASAPPARRERAQQLLYPSISANGRFVAFTSYASNLVAGDENGQPKTSSSATESGARRRGSASLTRRAARPTARAPIDPSISADGRFVAFISAPEPGHGDRTHTG